MYSNNNWNISCLFFFLQEQLKRGSSLFNRAAFGNVGIPAPGTPIPNA